jgi:hypothetical protein
MNFKFKYNENTTFEDARVYLDELKRANVVEFILTDINRILNFLEVEELASKGGSAIRFQHKILKGHPYYHEGIFTIHVKHKGGDQRIISKIDFKSYMLPALIQIIDLLDKKK